MLLCSVFQSSATHLIGGYMNYRFMERTPNGDYRYRVTLNLYRDALNSVIPFTPEIKVGVYLNDTEKKINQTVRLGKVIQREVEAPGSIKCDFYKKEVKIEWALYEGTVTLKPNTSGYHLAFEQCCRNQQNNIVEDAVGPSQGQTYYCFIPNTSLENSSPAFYGVPSPYMCKNDTNSFLFDAVDADGDSLVYKVMRPFGGASRDNSDPDPQPTYNPKQLLYAPGYHYTQPFGPNGVISVDPSTGRTILFSPDAGRYVIGIEVFEYRNGVLIGNVRMDLQIDVLDCIPNTTPDIYSDEGKRFVIEEGEELCFDVFAEDADGDIVTLTGRGVLLGDGDTTGITQATFEEAQGVGNTSSEFCWIPGCDMARNNPYYVYFTVEDDGCPPKFNHLDVEIRVIPFEGAVDLSGPTDVCRFNSYEYQISGGGLSSTYEWDISQGVIVGKDNDSIVTIDWEGTGTGIVRVREVSGSGCYGDWIELDVNITESPLLPIILGKDTVCSSEANLKYTVADNPLNSFDWEIDNATMSQITRTEIDVLSYTEPSFTIKVSETNPEGCTSDTAILEVFVSVPDPEIEGPIIVCPNSKSIEYNATENSGSTYQWTVIGGVQSEGTNTAKISVDWGNEGAGRITVVETNRFGCVSVLKSLNVSKSYDLGTQDIEGLTDVCEYETGVEYSASEVKGNVYIWTINGGSQVTGDTSCKITVNWGAFGPGVVTVYQRAFDNVNGKQCLSSTTDYPVNIHPLPTADEIVGDMELCQYTDTIEYTVIGMPNSSYEWTVGGSSQNIIGQGTNTIKVVWNNAGTFAVTAKETSEFDCPGTIIDTFVTINPKPVTSPISGDSIICPESTVSKAYSVVGFPSSTFNWNVNGELSFTGDGTSTVLVDWDSDDYLSDISVQEVSDKGCVGDVQFLDIEFDNLAIDLDAVSVGTPDDRMEIRWSIDSKESTDEFIIEKRIAGSSASWSRVAVLSGRNNSYLEKDINTDLNAFEYRVTAYNKCGTLITSEIHTNILLSGYQDELFNSILDFSEYYGWSNGVANYDMFGNDNSRPYSILESNVTPNGITVVEHNPDQYRKCYRIKADEREGKNETSWSNELCFFFSPSVIVPNAFTPNDDGLNDGFGVKGIAINEFNMKIYSRWGEKLYDSDDLYEKWKPVYRSSDVQIGTYIYLITFTDYQDKVYQKSGTINLLR